MGCTSSREAQEGQWSDVSANTPVPKTSSKPLPHSHTRSKATRTAKGNDNSNGSGNGHHPDPSPLSASSQRTSNLTATPSLTHSVTPSVGHPLTPPVNKKLTLLQSRSLSSKLSMQSSGNSLMSSAAGSVNGSTGRATPSLPHSLTLDTSILVEVPDDFRKKYKIISIVSEKDIDCFAFHGAALDGGDDYDGATSEENSHCNEGVSEGVSEGVDSADVMLYKGIDRQKKYVMIEKTLTHSFKKSSLQIEYFNRIDNLRLLNHMCIPTILDVFDTPHDYTIVFQYGVGKSLAELMSQRGSVSNPEALRAIVLAVVDTLKHLHTHSIAHRNLSADQLIVSRFNHFSRAKDLTVTGLSRIAQIPAASSSTSGSPTPRKLLQKKSTSTASSITVRSVGEFLSEVQEVAAVPERYLNVFSAPELSRPGHGLEVDLYSLGVVVYSLLAGAVPEDKSDLRMDTLTCTSSLKRLVSSLLRTDPSQRPSLRRVEKYFAKSYLQDEDVDGEDYSDAQHLDLTIEHVRSNSSCSMVESDQDQDTTLGTDDKSVVSGTGSCGSTCSSIAISVAPPHSDANREAMERAIKAQTHEKSRRMLLNDDDSDC
jgi:serine/threonine protein kinase